MVWLECGRVMRDTSGQIVKLGPQTMDFTLFAVSREEPLEAPEQPSNLAEQAILSYAYFLPPIFSELPKPTTATSKWFSTPSVFFSPKTMALVECPTISHPHHDSLLVACLVLQSRAL